jgi:hypothetical protein
MRSAFILTPVNSSRYAPCTMLSASSFRNPKFQIERFHLPIFPTPPIFGTFWGFFLRSRKYMVNLIRIKTLKRVFHYFADTCFSKNRQQQKREDEQ